MVHNGNCFEIEIKFYYPHSFIKAHSYYKALYMSNGKLLNVSNDYMLLVLLMDGVCWWEKGRSLIEDILP
jgi:hypothetical protein